MNWLSRQDIIDLNKFVLAKSHSSLFNVQYPQGLDIVIQQPQQIVFGHELYPNVWIKAAFIIQKITKNIFLLTEKNAQRYWLD